MKFKHAAPHCPVPLRPLHQKDYNAKTKKVTFKTGPIPDKPYVALRSGQIVREAPKIRGKKARVQNQRAARSVPGGRTFRCHCGPKTYHVPATWRKGGNKDVPTYQCCLCGTHYDKAAVDESEDKKLLNEKAANELANT